MTSAEFSADGKTLFVERGQRPSTPCALPIRRSITSSAQAWTIAAGGGGGRGGGGGGGGRGGAASDSAFYQRRRARSQTKRGANGEQVVLVGDATTRRCSSRARSTSRTWTEAGAAHLGRQARHRDRPELARLREQGRRRTTTSSRRSTTTTRSSSTRTSRRRWFADAYLRDTKTGTEHASSRTTRTSRPKSRGEPQAHAGHASARRLQVLGRRHAAEGLASRARGCRASSGSIRASTRRRRSTIGRSSRRTSTSSPNVGRRAAPEIWVTQGYALIRAATCRSSATGQDERQLHRAISARISTL